MLTLMESIGANLRVNLEDPEDSGAIVVDAIDMVCLIDQRGEIPSMAIAPADLPEGGFPGGVTHVQFQDSEGHPGGPFGAPVAVIPLMTAVGALSRRMREYNRRTIRLRDQLGED